MPSSTASGYDDATWAVDGCPADAVNYALNPANGLYAADSLPHVVISGINRRPERERGRRHGESPARWEPPRPQRGTTASRRSRTSQGSSVGAPAPPPDSDYDYDSGVAAALAWLAEHRSALAAGTVTTDTD